MTSRITNPSDNAEDDLPSQAQIEAITNAINSVFEKEEEELLQHVNVDLTDMLLNPIQFKADKVYTISQHSLKNPIFQHSEDLNLKQENIFQLKDSIEKTLES